MQSYWKQGWIFGKNVRARPEAEITAAPGLQILPRGIMISWSGVDSERTRDS